MKEEETGESPDYEKEEREAIREEGQDAPKKARKPRARKQSSGPNLVGWFLEAYPLKPNESGKLAPQYPPTVFELTKSKNLKQAMEQYHKVAETTPEKIADCYCRILQVHKDFRTKVRQIVDIV
jgi:hypothetical protein